MWYSTNIEKGDIMDKPIKDKQLKQYELMEYFGAIARALDPAQASDMLIRNLAEGCPARYLEDLDMYITGKLLALVESCIIALQSVPHDRSTPIQVKAALSQIGVHLSDIKDPKREELKELMNG